MKDTIGRVIWSYACLLLLGATPCLAQPIFLDNYDPSPGLIDLTNFFRTPNIGPVGSWARWEPDGTSSAQTTTGLDGFSAGVNVPSGNAMDYQGYLVEEYTGRFLLQWSLIVDNVNQNSADLGNFSVRFPQRDSTDMQVLFSFMNDGRLITFTSDPQINGLASIEQVGTFLANTRYDVSLVYDLVNDLYSVSLNGANVITNRAIPDYLDRTTINMFGFDINQFMQLDGHPLPPGNLYNVDNISLSLETVAEPVPEPATMALFGTGIAGLAFIRRKKRE